MGGRAERNRRNWGRPRVVVARSRPPLLLDVRPRFPRRKPSPMGGDGGPRVHQRAKVTDTKRLRSGTYRLIREPYLVERSSRSSAGHGSCSLSLSCPVSPRLPRFRPTRTPSFLVSPACEKEKEKPRPVEIGSSRKILRLGTPTSGKVTESCDLANQNAGSWGGLMMRWVV